MPVREQTTEFLLNKNITISYLVYNHMVLVLFETYNLRLTPLILDRIQNCEYSNAFNIIL